MELRDRALARLTRATRARWPALAAAVALLLVLLVPAAHAADLTTPTSATKPPKFFKRSSEQVERIADRNAVVRAERREDGRMDPTAYTKGYGRWQVSYFRDGDEVAQVQIDDRTGAVTEAWRNEQVAWSMARGYSGAFGRSLNAPYVWIPLCLLFLAPFVDVRRPFRLLHLDLLVLLGFGVSHVFFNRGEIDTSVPLVYPVLLYLLVRVLLAGFRPRAGGRGPLVPHMPIAALLIGVVFLMAFRIGLNVTDSNVIDVGYAGVIGADHIVDGDPLYGPDFADDVERGDTYGPLDYLVYVPWEQALPWSGSWDDLPAAHGAAVTFDVLALLGLFWLGRRLRPGREGLLLGGALAWAWAAYPYTAFSLETNSNDTLVAVACIAALLALTVRREALGGVARGAAVAAGTAAKFSPLVLAPLFLRGVEPADAAPTAALRAEEDAAAELDAEPAAPPLSRRRPWLGPLLFCLTLVVVLTVIIVPFLPEGGFRELYDRTIGYQASRPSPFSVWGQWHSIDWLQTVVKATTVVVGVLVAFVPRRRDVRQVAALGAAVLILLQLSMTHWFYLYVVWFVPFIFVAILCAYGTRSGPPEPAAEEQAEEPTAPLAPAAAA